MSLYGVHLLRVKLAHIDDKGWLDASGKYLVRDYRRRDLFFASFEIIILHRSQPRAFANDLRYVIVVWMRVFELMRKHNPRLQPTECANHFTPGLFIDEHMPVGQPKIFTYVE